MPAGYIVLEGGDGCGKDTQLPLVEARMNAVGLGVSVVREPYDSPTYGEVIRDMLYTRNGQPNFAELPWHEQARLMNAARVEVMAKVRQVLAMGNHVLSSRNWFSTMAYQGHAQKLRQVDLGRLRRLCLAASSLVQPDQLILIDIPAAEALARQGGKDKDANEQLPVEFHDAVRQGYLLELGLVRRSAQFPVEAINASNVGVGDLTDQIWAQIEPLLS